MNHKMIKIYGIPKLVPASRKCSFDLNAEIIIFDTGS